MSHCKHGFCLPLAALVGVAVLLAGGVPAQPADNPVAGSGQTRIDRPLTADRPGEYLLGRGTAGSGADFGGPASTPLLRGTPKAGSGDPNRLGAEGSPYRSESSGRLRGPHLEGNSITGGSVTRD